VEDNQGPGQKPSSRRGFFLGAATVGAAAVAATALPKVGEVPAATAPSLPPAPEKGGGYSLSEHVKRYYQSASA
jgi:hypothetical protein